MSDTVIAIVSAFFIIGITVGIIAVVAMSALRTERRGDQGGNAGPFDDSDAPADPDWDDPDSGQHRRWPVDTGNDFSGR